MVYRGGDAVSAWLKALLDAIGLGAALVALVGAGVALAWSAVGWRLGRHHEQTATPQEVQP
ncbi:hypothetical protein D3C72_2271370 [compost metagenome]